MNAAQSVAIYEDLLAVTERMLQAARCSDWEELVALEKKCQRLVERLTAAEPREPLSGRLRERKAEIIRQVLACDAEITNIIDPWMKELQSILSSAGHEKKLQRAYGPG